MPRVKKPTIQRPALQDLCSTPPQNNPNLTTPFALLAPSPPPPPPALPTALPTLPANHIEDIPVILAIDYADRFHAGLNFRLELDAETNRSSICRYQTHMQNVIEKMKAVCYYCGLFTSVKESSTLHIHNQLMSQLLGLGLLLFLDLDSCGIVNKVFRFCHQCFLSLQYQELSKYGSCNKLPQVSCQSYPAVLSCLSIAEEAVIACADPVIFILKLRLNGSLNHAAYHAIKGHVVLLPQNPSPLLTLLPSLEIELYDLIRVVWCGNRQPTDYNLRYFVQVKRQKLVNALFWLQEHNSLYRDIVINHNMLKSMPDEFIPEGISSRIVIINQDSGERERYGANLDSNNDENDLQHALGTARIKDSGLLTGCIYTNVNKARQNPYIKLISAINNLQTTATAVDNASQPMLAFNFQGNRIALNDWDNAGFFCFGVSHHFPSRQ